MLSSKVTENQHTGFKVVAGPLAAVMGVFLLSLLSFLAILVWDRSDEIAIFFTYLMSLGTACVINFFILKRNSITLEHNGKVINMLTKASHVDGQLLCLVDKNLNCIYLTSHFDYTALKMRGVLERLSVSSTELVAVEEFIRSGNLNMPGGRLLHTSGTLYIREVSYKGVEYDLVIQPITGEEMYGVKLRHILPSTNRQSVERFPFGYFELEGDGIIREANKTFWSYFHKEACNVLWNTQHRLSDLLLLPEMVQYESLKQTFVTSRANPDKDYFILVLTKDVRYKGFIIKLQEHNVRGLLRVFQKYWLDYTWECLLEKSPYPTCTLLQDGSIIRANEVYRKEISNKKSNNNFLALFNKEDVNLLVSTMSLIASGAANYQLLSAVGSCDGKRTFEVTMARTIDIENKFDGFIVRVKDITQQKQMQDNLSHAQRMQTVGQLVGSVAHDFNNILTAISGFCDLLLLRHGMGDPSFSNIMQIKQSSERASGLVRRLLAFSRKQTLQLQVVNPIDLFGDFTPLIQRLIGTRIRFSQYIDPNIWYIRADPVQMEQVVLNLVVNAQHAIGDEGILSVKVENYLLENYNLLQTFAAPPGEKKPPLGEYVSIAVRDSGYGIKKENLKNIFEPFFTTKAQGIGTGLGLSTVYGVVRQSDAYIFVKSKVGKYTQFLLLFPRAMPQEEERVHQPESIKNQESLSAAGTGTIILVEDEDAIRMFAKKALTIKGYTVIDFSSAQHALEKITKDRIEFDLLLTDVLMPEMSGPNLVNKLQKYKPDIKVIFISGYAEEAFTEEYGDKRDFNFLAKPFSLKQLLVKVKEVISS